MARASYLAFAIQGSPDRGARHVSSWGIRMKFLRIAMHAPCHQGEGSLHLAHADGPPCDIAHSTWGGILSGQLSTFSGYLTSGWEKRAFQLPRSDMSGSSDRIFHIRRLTPDGRGGRFNFSGQACRDPLITLTWRVFSQYTVPRCSLEAS
uniref:Uncharacterized protein n=1 Tax=Vitis vinifera TaxID=29760 RepID=A5B3V7_VITVI|nr:hypothetical protein VITISV_041235 [Vitis vinifera]